MTDEERQVLFEALKPLREARIALQALESAVRGPDVPGGSINETRLGASCVGIDGVIDRLEQLAFSRELDASGVGAEARRFAANSREPSTMDIVRAADEERGAAGRTISSERVKKQERKRKAAK